MKKHYFLMSRMMMLLLSFFILTNVAQAQLIINEFLASNDAAYAGPQGDYPDLIEIYNAGDEAVMLGGYYFCDTLDVTQAYQVPSTYPDSVTVQAGGYIVFYANKLHEQSVVCLDMKLSGGGEQIGLWNPAMELVEGLTYTEQTTDISYGRYPDGGDFWGFMTEVTPYAPNAAPEYPAVSLFINEFMASNDDALPGPQGDYPDWIEIYNAGTEAVMLGGFYMCDTLDVNEAYQIPSTYPDSVTVPAGGYIILYANKLHEQSVVCLDMKLSGGGEQIGLWNPVMEQIDGLTYDEQMPDTTFGRFPDGSDTWMFMLMTPGAANENNLSVNEIDDNASVLQNYPNPFSGETHIEFTLDSPDKVTIEIYNVSGAKVSTLVNDNFTQGNHMVKWDASAMPAGFYFYTLQTSQTMITKKALIVR